MRCRGSWIISTSGSCQIRSTVPDIIKHSRCVGGVQFEQCGHPDGNTTLFGIFGSRISWLPPHVIHWCSISPYVCGVVATSSQADPVVHIREPSARDVGCCNPLSFCLAMDRSQMGSISLVVAPIFSLIPSGITSRDLVTHSVHAGLFPARVACHCCIR